MKIKKLRPSQFNPYRENREKDLLPKETRGEIEGYEELKTEVKEIKNTLNFLIKEVEKLKENNTREV